jgi:hypothetical protein
MQLVHFAFRTVHYEIAEEPRRIVSDETRYGDASACLKLRTPLIRRDPQTL